MCLIRGSWLVICTNKGRLLYSFDYVRLIRIHTRNYICTFLLLLDSFSVFLLSVFLKVDLFTRRQRTEPHNESLEPILSCLGIFRESYVHSTLFIHFSWKPAKNIFQRLVTSSDRSLHFSFTCLFKSTYARRLFNINSLTLLKFIKIVSIKN